MNYEVEESSILTSTNKVHNFHAMSSPYTNSVAILDFLRCLLKCIFGLNINNI